MARALAKARPGAQAGEGAGTGRGDHTGQSGVSPRSGSKWHSVGAVGRPTAARRSISAGTTCAVWLRPPRQVRSASTWPLHQRADSHPAGWQYQCLSTARRPHQPAPPRAALALPTVPATGPNRPAAEQNHLATWMTDAFARPEHDDVFSTLQWPRACRRNSAISRLLRSPVATQADAALRVAGNVQTYL